MAEAGDSEPADLLRCQSMEIAPSSTSPNCVGSPSGQQSGRKSELYSGPRKWGSLCVVDKLGHGEKSLLSALLKFSSTVSLTSSSVGTRTAFDAKASDDRTPMVGEDGDDVCFVSGVRNSKASQSQSLLNPFTVARVKRSISKAGSLFNLSGNGGNPAGPCSLDEVEGDFVCKLCLDEVPISKEYCMQGCGCAFCKDCVVAYATFQIKEGQIALTCPDARCKESGRISSFELLSLVPKELFDLHQRFRFQRDVDLNPELTWCPMPNCEGVCKLGAGMTKLRLPPNPFPVTCPECRKIFCLKCHAEWSSHVPNAEPSPDATSALSGVTSCPASETSLQSPLLPQSGTKGPGRFPWSRSRNGKKKGIKMKMDSSSSPAAAFSSAAAASTAIGSLAEAASASSVIKECPNCRVFIERNDGCAQMMCRRCNHIFCWFCLAPLDGDFLLRHYSRGPCKDKLGHSRAAVIWYRAQVVALFVGFGLLTAIAAPVILVAAPCILGCSKLNHKRHDYRRRRRAAKSGVIVPSASASAVPGGAGDGGGGATLLKIPAAIGDDEFEVGDV